MLFNSFEFFAFLPLVFLLYWGLGVSRLRSQNILLLVASYIFYGWWDWRFLSLILFSTLVDYTVGLLLGRTQAPGRRKVLLWCSIAVNLGLLGFFKYYNFFVDSFADAFSFFGYPLGETWTLNIILPVGISFYTFQTLSYTIDVYRRQLEPTRDFIAFAAFVSFFPQLVAGPIERASQLLPQIASPRKLRYGQWVDGLLLILWGLFKKVAIADSLGMIVDDIFAHHTEQGGLVLLMGAVLFGFQIYGDFSGYSDIAIGTAKLFGIELMSNFRFPYFSRNISEFWHRWHISLSTWFRDYLYIPLGGSRLGKGKALRNIFIIFLVSGFWHGANWTFLIWGGIHACLYVPLFIGGQNRSFVGSVIGERNGWPTLREVGQTLLTFLLVSLAWIYFRAPSLAEANAYLGGIFSRWEWTPYHHPMGYRMWDYAVLLLFFVAYEYGIRRDERRPIPFRSRLLRWSVAIVLLFGLLLFYQSGTDRSFIYFQF
ncbi:MBOAT family O-acyltransferase [Robiginitalea sp. M366]|uniref:MBOAT family O-acyltransferase n=1 Tax=Robiginitalea aestuariiviva TaxID=3036903 RepID=UPI00240D2232|nr:MBOAT family O-acyltransferase [Robiginitalea aestuariiviva]MDG1572716.1 MBOAT family O-acyltransferase [Robiginitalea aestuariiviva]